MLLLILSHMQIRIPIKYLLKTLLSIVITKKIKYKLSWITIVVIAIIEKTTDEKKTK